MRGVKNDNDRHHLHCAADRPVSSRIHRFSVESKMTKHEKKKLDQIILRYDDEFGHHIIRTDGQSYSIEGYEKRPENYQKPPQYFFPLPEDEVEREFKLHGKEFRRRDDGKPP